MDILFLLLGWVGMALVLAGYYLVSHHEISSRSRMYQYINLFGALTLGSYTFWVESWPGFCLQVAWFLVALAALWRHTRRRKNA